MNQILSKFVKIGLDLQFFFNSDSTYLLETPTASSSLSFMVGYNWKQNSVINKVCSSGCIIICLNAMRLQSQRSEERSDFYELLFRYQPIVLCQCSMIGKNWGRAASASEVPSITKQKMCFIGIPARLWELIDVFFLIFFLLKFS